MFNAKINFHELIYHTSKKIMLVKSEILHCSLENIDVIEY